MKITISTHQGKLYDEEVDYIVCKNEDGEFAILKNHAPIISTVQIGTIKLVLGEQSLYVAINNGMLEFKNNHANIIAQGAFVGRDKESAREHLNEFIEERLEKNRKATVEMTQKERDLYNSIKKTGAGRL